MKEQGERKKGRFEEKAHDILQRMTHRKKITEEIEQNGPQCRRLEQYADISNFEQDAEKKKIVKMKLPNPPSCNPFVPTDANLTEAKTRRLPLQEKRPRRQQLQAASVRAPPHRPHKHRLFGRPAGKYGTVGKASGTVGVKYYGI